jgi:hypothetical protein
MRIKDGELHNRGGRGDSVPCIEDTTIRAMQIKSVLMQVSGSCMGYISPCSGQPKVIPMIFSCDTLLSHQGQ